MTELLSCYVWALQTHHYVKDRYQKGTRRFPNSRCYDYLPKSTQQIGPIGVPPENNDGRSSSSLALKEIPPLAHNQNPIPSQFHHPDQLAEITLPISQCSPTFGNIDFGTYSGSPPPLGLHTNVAMKQADSYDLVQKGNLVDVTPENSGAQNNCNFNFSLEEFPLLTRSTPKASQSDKLAAKNPQFKHLCPAFGFANNDVGTRGDSSSLSKLPSMASSKQADSHDQYLSESTPSVRAKGISNQEESLDWEKETYGHI